MIVKTFLASKLIRIVSGDPKDISTATVALCQKLPQSKIIIADNWAPKVVNVTGLAQLRMQSTQACIVRLMKARRMMKLRQLSECIINDMSHMFPLTQVEVIQCIRSLVASGYIEQDDDQHIIYIE